MCGIAGYIGRRAVTQNRLIAAMHAMRHRGPVEFMFAVPGAMKIRDGVTKHLLRESMRGVLPEVTRGG